MNAPGTPPHAALSRSRLTEISEAIATQPLALVVFCATLLAILAAAAFCYALYALVAPEFFSRPMAMVLPLAAPAVTAPPMFLACAVAIRRQVQLRRELAEKQAELQRHLGEIQAVSEKLQLARLASEEAAHAKSMFLASMSHELRTPLNAIIGFSEIILTEQQGPIANRRYGGYIEDIHTAGEHLLSLVNDILDLSKIEAGKLTVVQEELDLPEAFEDAMRLLRPRFEEHAIALTQRIAEDATRACADRRALLQILLNLLSNALRYTPEGGSVEVLAQARGQGWRLEVRDNGIGIDPAEIERVTQPFERIEGASISPGGTGLGLTLVKGLMELHGGAMAIESPPEGGTRVLLDFPRLKADSCLVQ